MVDSNAQPGDRDSLDGLGQWDDFIEEQVYPEPHARARKDYRNYTAPPRDGIREFYQQNHHFQTYDLVQQKRREFLGLHRRKMSVLESLNFLNTLIDGSDPDIELDQLQHLLQTAEAIRADGHEEWFVLTGLLHDLGKVLCLFGEPQWAVTGDTFPVGCQFSDRIVYSELFDQNPDAADSRYNHPLGVYEAGCGLRNVLLSWGHDEYCYHVFKDHLPEAGLCMIRYHSFYAWHREGEYDYLCDDHDRKMLTWVQRFNEYDLYSKFPEPPDWQQLQPYYMGLIKKYLPATLDF